MAPYKTLVVCVISLSLSGCAWDATTQDYYYCWVNKNRAADAWKACFSKEQRRCLSNDFESGYKTGYYDTATGKDCRLPPVPPPKYWSAKYQCCEGREAIDEWFLGYQRGILAAQSSGLPSFHDIPTSVGAPIINQTACGLCYSPDRCECLCQGDVAASSIEMVPPQPTINFPLNGQGLHDAIQERPVDSATPLAPPAPNSSEGALRAVPRSRRQSLTGATANQQQVGVLQPVGGIGVEPFGLIGPIDQSVIQASDSTVAQEARR